MPLHNNLHVARLVPSWKNCAIKIVQLSANGKEQGSFDLLGPLNKTRTHLWQRRSIPAEP